MIRSYDSYRSSGFEWLGDIPSHWKTVRIGAAFQERNEKVSDSEFFALSVTKNGIVPQMESVAKTDAGDNRKRVNVGDFVINSRSDRKGSSGVSELEGSVSLISIVLKPNLHDPSYIHHLFRSYNFQEEFYRNGKGIVADLWSTRFTEMKNISVPLFDLGEQKAIAKYLDNETQRIDSLICEKQSFIALLKEKRQALISHFVTKGLDPNVPMKDSGVEWLGEIPEHWSISRLSYLATVNGRVGWKALKADEYVDEGYAFLSTPNIKGKHIDFDNTNRITEERYIESPEIILEIGDVLLAKDGSTLGITAYVDELPRAATVNSSIAVLKTFNSKLYSEYLYWFLLGEYMQNIIQRKKEGMGVPHLFQKDINKFTILIPDFEEQKRICEKLRDSVGRLDFLLDEVRKSIDLLREYRTSLISAAVTGKINVRGMVDTKVGAA